VNVSQLRLRSKKFDDDDNDNNNNNNNHLNPQSKCGSRLKFGV
jgi:hypothetical protein